MKVRYHHIDLTNGYYFAEHYELPVQEIDFLHYHHCLELGVCEQGHGIIIIEDKYESVQEGDAVFVAPGVKHYSRSLRNCLYRWVFVGPEHLPCDLIRGESVAARFAGAKSMVLRGAAGETCSLAVNAFIQAQNDQTMLDTAAVLLTKLSLELPLAEPTVSVNDSLAADAATYMKLHYSEPLRIAAIADLFHLSESRFRRRFQSAYSCPPQEYLSRIRANIGAEFLLRTQMSIAEIASAVGFADVSQFYRCFMKAYYIPPSKYREQHSLHESL